jgi:hypothetical protein
MDQIELKPITVDDYKEYAQKHGITINVDDETLADILDRGNKLEQEHIKAREVMRENHRERMSKLMEKVSEPDPQRSLDELLPGGEG